MEETRYNIVKVYRVNSEITVKNPMGYKRSVGPIRISASFDCIRKFKEQNHE